MTNIKKRGARKIQSHVQAWKARVRKPYKYNILKECCICSTIPNMPQSEFASASRLPTRDFTLLNVALFSEQMREAFIAVFCRLSKADRQTTIKLISCPTDFYLCHVHINHSRYAQEAAMRGKDVCGSLAGGVCVFHESGCSGSGSRLRRLPIFRKENLDAVEDFFQFQEAVLKHSGGLKTASEVQGKYSCSHCAWIITQGRRGSPPDSDLASLTDSVDRWLVRCILFAMHTEDGASDFISNTGEKTGRVSRMAKTLKASVLEPVEGVPILPFRSVVNCREQLSKIEKGDDAKFSDKRAMERRICAVLAGKNIHLKKISTRTRCYVIGGSFEEMISSRLQTRGSVSGNCLSVRQRNNLLDQVESHFKCCKAKYWNGEWNLNEEIASIPTALWRDFVLQMCSKRKLSSWQVAAKARGKKLEEVFPLSNSMSELPSPSIEATISDMKSDYCRSDLLLCVRTLKVLEQVVFSRSNSVAGPLTVCMSISGIVELSPSFVSVQNAMGLTLSYNVTEAYRLRLIAERERSHRGAWQNVLHRTNENSIPSCQFDNWNINPLHAVKAEGKVNPQVNGSLLQGVTGKRRCESKYTGLSPPEKRRRFEWRNPALHGSREDFAAAFHSPERNVIIQQFCDIVFGLVITHRDKLLGSPNIRNNPGGQRRSSVNLTDKPVVSFKSLLLSAFKPHGGANLSDNELSERDVVYVDVSRENAADVLTVRRMLGLVQTLLTPGNPGCPKYVVVAGDQPTYKMLVELWLRSWREHSGTDRLESHSQKPLHEWLVPFPGFFHAEKQAMYSSCKELLDGVGLQELAACAGLSLGQLQNILKHSHARNNRALLFSLACALVIHVVDKIREEVPEVDEKVSSVLRKMSESLRVSSDLGNNSHRLNESKKTQSRTGDTLKTGLFAKTADSVSYEVLQLGTFVRNAVKRELCQGPNGKHFIGTVLFDSLLPTLGFHVLSRTGHTDVTDAFWFRLTYVLHASNHLKYQELSLFYAFLRGILPPAVSSELHEETPGASVLKLPSFTSSHKNVLDLRGWTYVHLDEALEMLIVRHLKSLSVNLLSHLENSAAWLMQVSKMRSLARRVTGASRAYGRFRGSDDVGEQSGPLFFYDRNAPQTRTVNAMLQLMRQKGFLNVEHRGTPWLTNVFSTPPKRMTRKADQDLLLEINKHGKITTALHASVLFPDVFGGLTKKDRKEFFDEKKFKKWTAHRKVLTPGKSMGKEGGVVALSSNGHDLGQSAFSIQKTQRQTSATKLLSDRRRYLSRTKDTLYLFERKAERMGDVEGKREAYLRWDKVHAFRHLVSPHADAYFTINGEVCHAQKSRMLKCPQVGGRENEYTFNAALSANELLRTRSSRADKVISNNVMDVTIGNYFSVQIDVMNALHYPGDDGSRGTTVVDIVTAKMKRILRTWMTGEKGSSLKHLHLHIDDPTNVIQQKRGEQNRRDSTRQHTVDTGNDCKEISLLPSFNDTLAIPWSHLIRNRSYKDDLASLHLICAAVAANELAREHKLRITVFLHGGAFVIPRDFGTLRMKDLTFRRFNAGDLECFKGRIFIETSSLRSPEQGGSEISQTSRYVAVPRGTAVILDTCDSLRLGSRNITHGEGETRFVAVFNHYIKPHLHNMRRDSYANREQRDKRIGTTNVDHGCVVVSDDTDVFIILLLAVSMGGFGILHVLGDSVHDIDKALDCIQAASTNSVSIATLYAFAGCDFLPGTFGIPHDQYLKSYLHYLTKVGRIEYESPAELYEYVMCLAYLYKEGIRYAMTSAECDEHVTTVMRRVESNSMSTHAVGPELKKVFSSQHDMGSLEWKRDVRNFISDRANSSCHLIPPQPHIYLQAARARFVVHNYWLKAELFDLSPSRVGGCCLAHGYTIEGDAVFSNEEDVWALQQEIKNVVRFCGCKSACNTNRCSCRKSNLRCMGCKCEPHLCLNSVNFTSETNRSCGSSCVPSQNQHRLMADRNSHASTGTGKGDLILEDESASEAEESSKCSNGSTSSEVLETEEQLEEVWDPAEMFIEEID